jgi:DNA-binding CsgD family transcriptional regulator
MAQWPTIARTDVVAEALEALERRPRRAVLLRGPSGIGKTTVAAHVAAAARRRGLAVTPMVALDTLSQVPLGALAPLLADPRFNEAADTASRYQLLLSLLSARSDEYLLIVDDAPLLDEVSAAGIYQLVRVLGVRCVLTARDGHEISGPLARLLHEDLVTEIVLHGISLEQSSELLREHFGTAIQPDSVRALFDVSRGNPMFLRELTFAAERSQAVHPGPHGLEIERARLPAHVVDGLSARLDLLDPAARELAELVAVSQLWPHEFCDEDALASLIEGELAEFARGDSTRFVRLTHPLYVEALVRGMAPSARRARQQQAAERLLSLDAAPLRFSGIRLSSTATVEQLEWAAGYAWAAGDHAAAVDLATAAGQRGGGFDGRLALASALSALGRVEAASVEFAAARAAADTDLRTAVAVSRWAQHRAYREHDPSAAAALVAAELEKLSEPTAIAVLGADLVKLRLMAGVAHDAQLAATASASTQLDAPGAFSASLGEAMMHTLAGAVEPARDAVERARPLAAELTSVIPHGASLLDLNEFLILIGDGRTAEATAFATERRLEPFTEAAGLWSYALALVHQQRGDLDRATELAALAVEQLTWRDFTGLVGVATALHATLLAQRGSIAAAQALLDSLAPSLLEDPKVVLQTAEARAWIAVEAGDAAAGAAALAAAGRLGIDFGHALLASLALAAAARFGRAEDVVGLLEEAAAASTSRFMALAAAYARASADGDALALEQLATPLSEAGLGACGVAGLGQAITLHERAGRSEAARRASIARVALRTTGQDSGLAAPRSDLDLTDREFEVAALAGARVRSRQIAEQLGLSTRTVDNHLARIYRKLGIAGRTELEELFQRGDLPIRAPTA